MAIASRQDLIDYCLRRLGAPVSEIGDAYNEINKLDIEPVAGQIVVFPHYLKHQTLPYFGSKRRTVIAFNGGVKRK